MSHAQIDENKLYVIGILHFFVEIYIITQIYFNYESHSESN